MNKMNPDVKAQWVAALRSGEYTRGRESLRNGDRFCCLGVLCDLHAKAGLGAWDEDLYGLGVTIPPASVATWAGLTQEYPNPDVTINGHLCTVAEHNDGGATFAEIADAIEQQL